MKLLDLYCGAGGAAMGYYQSGFDDITGVDIIPQPHYPFKFVIMNALDYLDAFGSEFDLIHASPPCQRFSSLGFDKQYKADWLTPTLNLLSLVNRPYVVENVPHSPMRKDLELCGAMFGLRVIRHRWFQTPCHIPAPVHPPHSQPIQNFSAWQSLTHQNYITVAGHTFSAHDGRIAMQIDWMTRAELAQAVPPAYTRYIGDWILKSNKL